MLRVDGLATGSPAVSVRAFAQMRGVRVSMNAANADGDAEPIDPDEEQPQAQKYTEPTDELVLDMSQLASRIESVQESNTLEQRLEALEQAWVLVFDAETDEEAVYSMEMEEEEGAHVVLAFECATEAKRYAETLREKVYEDVATVQALDVAALVITSREADFRVGVVFKGDFDAEDETPSNLSQLITAVPDPDRMSLSITIVPDNIFADRTSDEFLDPSEDPVRVPVRVPLWPSAARTQARARARPRGQPSRRRPSARVPHDHAHHCRRSRLSVLPAAHSFRAARTQRLTPARSSSFVVAADLGACARRRHGRRRVLFDDAQRYVLRRVLQGRRGRRALRRGAADQGRGGHNDRLDDPRGIAHQP